MLKYNLFRGELDGKTIRDFKNKLDYQINDIEVRLEIIKNVLYSNDGQLDNYFIEYFNQNDDSINYFNVNINKNTDTSDENFICQQLEKMANYILFCDEAKAQNRKSEYPYLTNYACRQISKNEDNSNNENDINIPNTADVCNFKKIGKTAISREDIVEIPTLDHIQYIIDTLSKEINLMKSDINILAGMIDESTAEETRKRINNISMEVRKYENIICSMRDNQKFIKTMVKKPIYFKQPLHDSTKYDLSCIDFGNPHHVIVLLENYNRFKQSGDGDLNSDLRYIMMDFDNLIENTNLQSYEKDIVVLKIDGYNNEEILKYLEVIYRLEWQDAYLTKVFRSVIPKKIAKQYREEYEDWYYREVEKGEYKTCVCCGETKLVKQFGKDSRNKDGLQGICKKCDNLRKITGK